MTQWMRSLALACGVAHAIGCGLSNVPEANFDHSDGELSGAGSREAAAMHNSPASGAPPEPGGGPIQDPSMAPQPNARRGPDLEFGEFVDPCEGGSLDCGGVHAQLVQTCNALCPPACDAEQPGCYVECMSGLRPIQPGCVGAWFEQMRCLADDGSSEPCNAIFDVVPACDDKLNNLQDCYRDPPKSPSGEAGTPTLPDCEVEEQSTTNRCEKIFHCPQAELVSFCDRQPQEWHCNCSVRGLDCGQLLFRPLDADSPCTEAAVHFGFSY